MITPEYCLTMARYNSWQNKQLKDAIEELDETELRKDRNGFFGSILATANHILWGDLLWMARFDGGHGPDTSIAESVDTTPTFAVWSAERFRLDARQILWAEKLNAVDLVGDLGWYSGSLQAQVSRPIAQCVTHMFNHQTHHRGQIHTMLTQAGKTAPVSDLVFMPQEGPWP